MPRKQQPLFCTGYGASLGGYLAPRAAAFEKRITKVVGWSIFPDFFDILLADDPEPVRKLMDTAFRKGFAGIFNGFYRKMMDKSELVKWNLMHGMYAYDAQDPVGYVRKVRKFTLKGIGDKITQDDAGSHCGIGNMKLIHDTMVSWIKQMKDKNI